MTISKRVSLQDLEVTYFWPLPLLRGVNTYLVLRWALMVPRLKPSSCLNSTGTQAPIAVPDLDTKLDLSMKLSLSDSSLIFSPTCWAQFRPLV